jgi:hypothetical protein
MESLLIHPQDQSQLEQIKSYLTALEVEFEVKQSTLPPHVIAGLKQAMSEARAGNTISFEEFKQKHFLSDK